MAYQAQAAPGNNLVDDQLVTFSPEIRTTDDGQPCQGLRLSSTQVVTAPDCAAGMQTVLKQVDAIEVMNAQRQSVGQVKQLNNEAIKQGHLTLQDWPGNDDSPTYPSLYDQPLAADDELTASYLATDEEGRLEAVHSVVHSNQHSQQGRHHLFTFNGNPALPLGAPVSLDGGLVCVMTGSNECRGVAPVTSQPHKHGVRSVEKRQAGVGNAQSCSFSGQNLPIIGRNGAWDCGTCTACGCPAGCEITGQQGGPAANLVCICDNGTSCGTALGTSPSTGCLPNGALATVATTATLLLTLLATLLP